MSEAWQAAMVALVRERIGVDLHGDATLSPLEAFVTARAAALGLQSPASYVNYLRAEPPHGTEFARLTAVCTNGQTFFFRDVAQLTAVLEVARGPRDEPGPVAVWSAGCSTGEEPYSLALLFYQAGIDARILATDVNPEILQVAKRAVYGNWSLRHIPAELRERFFAHDRERYILKDKVREMVEFTHHNLIVPPLPRPAWRRDGGWDIVVCRNVLIYHAAETRAAVLANIADALQPEGWLFLGASEVTAEAARPVGDKTPFVVAAAHGGRFALQRRGPAIVATRRDVIPSGRTTARSGRYPELHADLYNDAIAQLTAGDYSAAEATLKQCIQQHPGATLAWLVLGHFALQRHDFEAAMEHYAQAQIDAPLLAEVHYYLGLVHRKVGNIEQAELALRQALFLAPDFWPASFLLAGVYDRMGKPVLSRRELMHTQNCVSDNPSAPLFRAHIKSFSAINLRVEDVLAACAERLAQR